MSSIYRQTYQRPVPDGAKIITRKGKRFARWVSRGRVRTDPLSSDGNSIVLEYACWYIDYTDHAGQRQTVKGFKDKGATQAKAVELERQAELVRSGIVSHDTGKCTMPFWDAGQEWLEDLRRRATSDKYRYYCQRWLVHMQAGCGWQTLGAMRSDDLTRYLADPKRQHLSPRQRNWYLETGRTFVRWCLAHSPPWLAGDPFAGIIAADESEKRAEKRAFTLEELLRLKDVSKWRWVVYLTAALTGLRKIELKRLLWGDVLLDADPPHIALRAVATKARRADTIPLNPEALEALRAHRPAGAKDSDRVFPRLPRRDTYKRDVEERAKIPWRDGLGRLASFHALRKTFGTYLALAGVPLRVAMDLMRLTDAKLLTGIYNDAKLLATAPAVGMLPRIGGVAAKNPYGNPDGPQQPPQSK